MSRCNARGQQTHFARTSTMQILFTVTKNSVQSFRTLGQPLLGEKYVTRKRRKIIPKILDTTLCPRAERAQTKLNAFPIKLI